MAERHGPCRNCQGKGKVERVFGTVEVLDKTVETVEEKGGYELITSRLTVRQTLEVRECFICGGTGFWGGAF